MDRRTGSTGGMQGDSHTVHQGRGKRGLMEGGRELEKCYWERVSEQNTYRISKYHIQKTREGRTREGGERIKGTRESARREREQRWNGRGCERA